MPNVDHDDPPFLSNDELKFLSHLSNSLNNLQGGDELDIVLLIHDGEGHLLGEMRKREDYGYVLVPRSTT